VWRIVSFTQQYNLASFETVSDVLGVGPGILVCGRSQAQLTLPWRERKMTLASVKKQALSDLHVLYE
jgi:hypothetical protein